MINRLSFLSLSVSFLAFLYLIPSSAHAEKMSLSEGLMKAIEEKRSHQGNIISEQSQKPFSNESLIGEFLNAAFSNDIWGTAEGRAFSYEGSEKDQTKLKGIPEFISEYVTREKGFPRLGVINKWDRKDIKIGFGWPTSEFSKWKKDIEIQERYYSEVSHIIRQESEKISSLGAVKLEFLDTETEKVRGYADIRIVPFQRPNGGAFPRFSTSDFHNDSRIWYLENFIKAGVRFSVGGMNQVEGYLLVDASNNIQQAVCYINVDMNNSAFVSYIDECLFRSLGLTGSTNYTGGILSARKDGELTTIGDKDIKLLSTLYDTRILSGDDKYAIINKLTN